MKEEKSTNPLVVQGIFKEAFFNQTLFSCTINNAEYNFIVTDILENKIRDSSDNKTLECLFLFEGCELTKGQTINFTAKFFRYTITGELVCEQQSGATIQFKLPTELTLNNQRQSDRTKVSKNVQKPVPVIINSNNAFTEGAFTVEDTSQNGFGGLLVLPESFELVAGSKIKGRIGGKLPIADINGTIVSILLKGIKKHGLLEYKVGITQDQVKKQSANEEPEKRKQTRYQSTLRLTLTPRLHQNEKIILLVDNLSINGIAGKIENPSAVSKPPIASYFEVEGGQATVRLMHQENERMHFQLEHSSEEESIRWLKQMTPLLYPGAQSSIKDYNEMYRIFLQAGAVSAKYLKRHQLLNELLVDEDNVTNDDDQNVYRWFVTNNSGKAEAHISAFRISQGTWVIGDGAKAADSNIIFSNLTKSFFTSIYEYSLKSSELKQILVFWTHNHPFWKGWTKALLENTYGNLITQTQMNYYRFNSEQIKEEKKVSIENISSNFHKIADILKKLSENSEKILQCVFDFSNVSTKSKFTSEYARSFFLILVDGVQLLGIVSQVASGDSVNRFSDSLFIFPLDKHAIPNESTLQSVALELGKQVGVQIPSIRVFSDDGTKEGTAMNCFLIRPDGLLEF